jgi:hypothetical protein
MMQRGATFLFGGSLICLLFLLTTSVLAGGAFASGGSLRDGSQPKEAFLFRRTAIPVSNSSLTLATPEATRPPQPTPTPIPTPPPSDSKTTDFMVLLGISIVVIVIFGIWINWRRVF